MSAAEAADRLGVSDRQVRRLAAVGDLPARRIGDRWLIDAAAVRDRSRTARRSGRPLSAHMAWAVLVAVDSALGEGTSARPLGDIEDRRVRHRLRALLMEAPPSGLWDQWLRRRADARRVWVHPGVLDRLARDERLHPAGAPAVVATGVGIGGGDRHHFYVAASSFDSVLADYRAQPAGDGQVVLSVVPSTVPDSLVGEPGEPVPGAVALVDLLSSRDVRERDVAASALEAAHRRLVSILRRG